MSIEEKVENMLTKPIENLGYEVYDVQYVKEGKDYYLRVFLDKDTGISLEDCEKVSNEINPILDQEDFIKEAYFLEVSSPGVERILRKDRHLQEAIGQEIEISLFKPQDGKKIIEGILQSYHQEQIEIQAETNIIIDRKNIAQIKKKFHWDK